MISNFERAKVFYRSMRIKALSILLLVLSGAVAMSQTPDTNGVTLLTTNRFPDGSTIKVEAVSFGTIHRIPFPYGQVKFFKSATSTIMFAVNHQTAAGHFLGESDDYYTTAEALSMWYRWYPLRSRMEPRPVTEGLEDTFIGFVSGPPPTNIWEIWEFPNSPEPRPSIRVRIWERLRSTNVASVEFELPNDPMWRKRSLKEQTNGFDPHEWLGGELFRAAHGGDLEYAKDLIAQGADPNGCDSFGMSALAMACQNNYTDIINYLLELGADVNAHSKGKPIDRTALMAACSNDGHPAIVRLLVERGAEVNTKGERGFTALHWAAMHGDVESVKYLLSKGANPNAKNQYGLTAFEEAESSYSVNQSEVLKILKNAQGAY